MVSNRDKPLLARSDIAAAKGLRWRTRPLFIQQWVAGRVAYCAASLVNPAARSCLVHIRAPQPSTIGNEGAFG
jgi:hypothetical protein